MESGGSQTVVWSTIGTASDTDGVWKSASVPLDAFAGETVRLRFVARDGGSGNLLEVEIDDIRVTRGS